MVFLMAPLKLFSSIVAFRRHYAAAMSLFELMTDVGFQFVLNRLSYTEEFPVSHDRCQQAYVKVMLVTTNHYPPQIVWVGLELVYHYHLGNITGKRIDFLFPVISFSGQCHRHSGEPISWMRHLSRSFSWYTTRSGPQLGTTSHPLLREPLNRYLPSFRYHHYLGALEYIDSCSIIPGDSCCTR
ncbi:MAG: hypothetical protein J3Q66DRAFT_336408 [Benniella sp.]|nr:MAG: hypothetical protein J3Q66DRAFT_336408 [Benniella sp.]